MIVIVQPRAFIFVFVFEFRGATKTAWTRREVVMRVATDGTAASRPLLQTCAVKDVLTEDGEETSCFVHAFEADWAGGEFD